MSRGRTRREQIQLLVAPARWTATMGIKRLFEEIDVPVRVIGAGSTEAALSQIKKNDSYTALLINWEEAGSAGMELAYNIKERGKPYIIAYQKRWSRDDIRRALQIGVHGLLLDPFAPQNLLRDLQSLTDTGEATSRRQILAEGGDELLEPDPTLWDGQADDWRERMMGMADMMHRPWSEDMSDRASHLEVSVRRKTQIEHLSPTMAKAVLEVLDQGRDRVPEITAKYRIDAGELLHVMGAVEKFAVKHGGASRIPLLMDEVLKRNEDAQHESRSPRLLVLKRVARVVIRANGVPGRRRDALNETIKKFLGIPAVVLKNLTAQDRFNLAMRFLMTDDESDALDQIGYVVIQQLVQAAQQGDASRTHLDALNSLLGFDGRHNGINPKTLIKALAVINPVPVLMDIDLKHLTVYRDLLGLTPGPDDLRLASALDQLIEVARPLGPIDQKRIKDLTQAIRLELPVLVGRSAWRSMLQTFEHPVSPPLDQVVDRLRFLVGARSKRASQLLHQAIKDLIDVGHNAMDAARFAEFCRQASSEPLSRDVIAAYAGETHDQFTPDKVDRTGAAEKRAMIEEALASFGNLPLDLQQIRQSLPPAPRQYTTLTEPEMTRVRVLAAVLEGRPLDEQLRIVNSLLNEHKFHTAEIDALEQMMGEGDLIDRLRADYHDPRGSFREGFDYELEEEGDLDAGGENFDYDDFEDDADPYDDDEFDDDADDDDWEDDDLDSIAQPMEGGVFDVGATPPDQAIERPQPTFDLGLDELEMELDLDGGVFDLDLGSLDESSTAFDPVEAGFDLGSMNRTRRGGSQGSDAEPRREPRSRPAAKVQSQGLIPRPDDRSFSSEKDFDLSFAGDADDENWDSGSGSLSGGFDVGVSMAGFDLSESNTNRRRKRDSKTKESQVPLTPEGALDLDAVREMVEGGALKQAARMLNGADARIPDLSRGLNYVALTAYMSEKHHAAHMLWTRAYGLDPDSPNIMYNLAHLRVDLGRYHEAQPVVERLLEMKPHLSLAHQLKETISEHAGGR